MADQSTFSIQVWNLAEGKKQQWETDGLFEGSHIKVAASEEEDYWIWEKVFESDEMFWRFRPSLSQQLAITYDDCNGVTMQPIGPKSTFKVYIENHGFVIHVPETQKYLAITDGVLVLSDLPVVWSLTFQYIKAPKPYAVIITEDQSQSFMWACDDVVQGSLIIVTTTSPKDENALWYVNLLPKTANGYHIQPKRNDKLYVTNDIDTNSVSLEGDGAPEKARILIGYELIETKPKRYHITDESRTRYLCTELEDDTKILALTADGQEAAAVWKLDLQGFGPSDGTSPVDPKSGRQKADNKC